MFDPPGWYTCEKNPSHVDCANYCKDHANDPACPETTTTEEASADQDDAAGSGDGDSGDTDPSA